MLSSHYLLTLCSNVETWKVAKCRYNNTLRQRIKEKKLNCESPRNCSLKSKVNPGTFDVEKLPGNYLKEWEKNWSFCHCPHEVDISFPESINDSFFTKCFVGIKFLLIIIFESFIWLKEVYASEDKCKCWNWNEDIQYIIHSFFKLNEYMLHFSRN